MRNVPGHKLGAPPPRSAKATQREIDDRHFAALIRELMPKLRNRHRNKVIQMVNDGVGGRDIWQWLQDEGVAPANDE